MAQVNNDLEVKSESSTQTVQTVVDGDENPYGKGLSVFHLICDVLGLKPLYKPHRNEDALTVARLLGRMIKDRLCRRKRSHAGRLTWVFESATSYERAMHILDLEPTRFRFM